jgi:hypothetical protein
MEMIKKSVEPSFAAKAPNGQAANPTSKNKLPEWKKAEPAAGDPKSKTLNGKTYHWCPHNKMWTIHSPTDCTLGKDAENLSDGKEEKKKSDDKKLALSKALMAIMEGDLDL